MVWYLVLFWNWTWVEYDLPQVWLLCSKCFLNSFHTMKVHHLAEVMSHDPWLFITRTLTSGCGSQYRPSNVQYNNMMSMSWFIPQFRWMHKSDWSEDGRWIFPKHQFWQYVIVSIVPRDAPHKRIKTCVINEEMFHLAFLERVSSVNTLQQWGHWSASDTRNLLYIGSAMLNVPING